jgi:hypothetical protein
VLRSVPGGPQTQNACTPQSLGRVLSRDYWVRRRWPAKRE